jgi:glycosyltransferase involved in cell wall biosynthesis
VGGAERQLQQLAPRLKNLGFDIVILTRHEPGLKRYEEIDGVPVYRLLASGPKPWSALTFTLSALLRLIRLRPDILHAHEILMPATIALWARRFLRRPVVVKLLRGGNRGDVYKLKKRPLWKTYVRSLRRGVDTFIVISQEIDEELAALGVRAEQRVFLPNGVDAVRCTPVSEERRQKLRQALNLPSRSTLVVYAGRLVPEKRVDNLLLAWKDMHEKHPDARLLILGEGAEAAHLREMRVEGVQFAGQVDDAIPYFQAADLFVLPSSTEGLSNSMLEAMACGLPVLATSVGGAPDVIRHHESGYLVPPEDREALQRGLETLLEDRALRFSLGTNARQRILAEFSLDSVAKRLAALYQKLL